MIRLCAGILIILTGSTTIAGQEVPPPDGPPLSPPAAVSPQPTSPEYSLEPFVIESYVTTAHYENDGTGERDLQVRVRVQSDAGVHQLGELVFGFNSANEQMDVRSVRVRKADSTVVAAAPEAVKEMTAPVARDAPVYTDFKEQHITVPALHPGDSLEYEIVTRLVTPLAPNEFWFEHNFLEGAIVLEERLEVNLPAGRVVNLQAAGFPYEKEDVGGRSIYHWKLATLAHPSDEEH